MLTAFGETKTVKDWSKDPRCRIGQDAIADRLKKGIDAETAITQPKNERRKVPSHRTEIGETFGRLTTIEECRMVTIVAKSKGNERIAKVLCRCECGKIKDIRTYSLRSGKTLSCGCLAREKAAELMLELKEKGLHKNPTHGMSNLRLYDTYKLMIRRCYQESSRSYKDYGARGITVCKEWKEDLRCFVDWAMANGYEEHLTIERIDHNGNYSPDNCTFITREKQAINKRNNVFVEHKGERKTLAEWSKDPRCVVRYHALAYRIRRKWDFEKALKTPSFPGNL